MRIARHHREVVRYVLGMLDLSTMERQQAIETMYEYTRRDNEEICESVEQEDGIAKLVHELRLPHPKAYVRKLVHTLLQLVLNFCDPASRDVGPPTEGMRRRAHEMVRCGGHRAVMDVLRGAREYDNTLVVCTLMLAKSLTVHGDAMKEALLRESVADVIVANINRGQTLNEALVASCLSLCRCLLYQSNAVVSQRLVGAGIINAIVRMLRRAANDPLTLQQGIYVLQLMAASSSSDVDEALCHAIPPLTRMAAQTTDESVMGFLVQFLYNMSATENAEARRVMLECGTADAMRRVAAISEEEDVREYARMILETLE